MGTGIDRPLDLLNSLKNGEVDISIKNTDDKVTGILIAFDININLVVKIDKKFRFIRGDNVLYVEAS